MAVAAENPAPAVDTFEMATRLRRIKHRLTSRPTPHDRQETCVLDRNCSKLHHALNRGPRAWISIPHEHKVAIHDHGGIMATTASHVIDGYVARRFGAVGDAFEENFGHRGELGAGCCVYY